MTFKSAVDTISCKCFTLNGLRAQWRPKSEQNGIS